MGVPQITARDLKARLDAGDPVYLIDVRQPWEHDLAALPDQLLAPLDELPQHLAEIHPPAGALVVAYCHHGIRSLHAAAFLAQSGIPASSLAGGIDHWSLTIDPSVPRY